MFVSDLIDSVSLEREVTNLKKELTACHDKEEALHAQLKELSPLQDLPDKVDGLLKQVSFVAITCCLELTINLMQFWKPLNS